MQPILRFLNVPENLLNTATQYVSVIIAGLVVTLLYDVLAATLRAIGDTVNPADRAGGVGGAEYRRRSASDRGAAYGSAGCRSCYCAVAADRCGGVCGLSVGKKSMKFCGYVWMI